MATMVVVSRGPDRVAYIMPISRWTGGMGKIILPADVPGTLLMTDMSVRFADILHTPVACGRLLRELRHAYA